MAATFELEILTPEARVFSGAAQALLAPGETGYLGVLAHHAPMLVALTVGRLEAHAADGPRHYFVTTGGFLYVAENRAVILAEAIERGDDIDLEEATQVAEAARRDFAASVGADRERTRVALAYAQARCAVARAARDAAARTH